MRDAGGVPGRVWLAGWGASVPDLIPERTRRALAGARVILSLEDPPESVRALLPAGVELRRTKSFATGAAAAITAARQGHVVALLCAGDPFLDADGAAAARQFESAGIPYAVASGVGGALAAALAAGAGLDPGPDGGPLRLIRGAVDRPPPPAPGTTVLASVAGNVGERLLAAGWPADAAALRVRAGGTPRQQAQRGRLAELAQLAPAADAIWVVGDAAGDDLGWFTRRPLHGRGVVVTRPRGQAAELAWRLHAAGARVIEFPTIELQAMPDPEELDAAIGRLGRYRWVLFTSANGVEFFFARLDAAGLDARAFGAARVGAIGPATAAALHRRGVRPDRVAERYQAEGLLEVLQTEDLRDAAVLLPRAETARDVLPETLRRRGARVDVVATYRAVRPSLDVDSLRQAIASGAVDAVTFTSSSTVRHFVDAFGSDEARDLLAASGVGVACIGPITAETARELGLEVAVEADPFTVPGLVEALERHFSGQPLRNGR